eukprot:scaffold4264_cov116-Isochrysis_galbana.AAC.8
MSLFGWSPRAWKHSSNSWRFFTSSHPSHTYEAKARAKRVNLRAGGTHRNSSGAEWTSPAQARSVRLGCVDKLWTRSARSGQEP